MMMRTVVLLVMWCVLAARAAPEDDYRAGSKAFYTGDMAQAMALLRKSADAGHAPSQAMLAYILDKAEFNDEAIAYYRKAAAQGNAEGEFGLGTMYAAGEGVKRDPVEARKWIALAAEKGHANAINVLALAYIKGGLGLDERQREGADALRWVRQASDAGYLPAMERMASAYRTGAYGVQPDTKQAEALEAKVRTAIATVDKDAKKKRSR